MRKYSNLEGKEMYKQKFQFKEVRLHSHILTGWQIAFYKYLLYVHME